MEIVTLLFFLLVTVYFIWSSKFSYGKKLVVIDKAFIRTFIAIGFVLKGLTAIFRVLPQTLMIAKW